MTLVKRREAKSLRAFAEVVDPERCGALATDLSKLPSGLLLATAFPPLVPALAWQREALGRIEAEGWRARRERSDYMTRLLSAVGNLAEHEQVVRNLRRSVWAERARIALRELLPSELGGAPFEVTARELSELAETAIEVALAEAANYAAQRYGSPRTSAGRASTLVVLGMGKLGGYELNAGSDVDLIFIYDTDDGGSELTLHEHWSRVVRRAVATMEEPTADGMVWRVDLRLRPEGSRGPLVNSMAAAERYYETWGRLWERAAMLRARAIAGAPELGRELSRDIIVPFVYRRGVDPSIVTAIAELLVRSRAELSREPARDLKLGPGGIREAEFFVQALQLVWGGREPSLRASGTLSGLGRLQSRGRVTDREARTVAAAYELLRSVEHRVQWMTGVQTHQLPPPSPELERLGRSLGYADGAALEAALDVHRRAVQELFAALLPEAPRPASRHTVFFSHLDEDPDELDRISAEVFGSEEVGEHLVALATRPDGLLGELTRERHPELADTVLDAVVGAPDPVLAARTLRAFFARFVSPAAYVAALAADPIAARRMATVLGSSAFVGDAVVGFPELCDVLLFGAGQPPDAKQAVSAEVAEVMRVAPADEDPWEHRDRLLYALRRAKRRVMVEVAVADLAGTIETRDATRVLSDLADETLEQSVSLELGPQTSGLAVLAVGKLGGREIGYGSDLDVLFVFEPERAPAGRDPQEHFSRAAQRIIRTLSEPHPAGPGYELDTRLRPSGSHGMLVTSLGSFARYHGLTLDASQAAPSVQSSGAPWERQALIRARAAAGDPEVGRRAEVIAARAAYERGPPGVEELHRLRMRMERELGQERPGRYELKTGRGGLLDVEFATQWLQMTHGRDPRVRTADTLHALEALTASGYLARPHYEILREAYVFLRRLEQRMHVLQGKSSTVLDEQRPGLTELARRMGFGGAGSGRAREELLGQYRDVTGAVRAAYLEVLGLAVE